MYTANSARRVRLHRCASLNYLVVTMTSPVIAPVILTARLRVGRRTPAAARPR